MRPCAACGKDERVSENFCAACFNIDPRVAGALALIRNVVAEAKAPTAFGWMDHVSDDKLPKLADIEAEYTRRVLSRMSDNKSKTARLLGIDRRTLYRKLYP